MSALAGLKLSAAKKPQHEPPIIQRRSKLARRLDEQIGLAKAVAAGTTYSSKRLKTVKSAEGERTAVEVAKRVKAWWFNADNGKLCLNVRYGARLLELGGKGKVAVEIASSNELVATLELIKSAVEAGELDAAMEAASGSLRKGFKR